MPTLGEAVLGLGTFCPHLQSPWCSNGGGVGMLGPGRGWMEREEQGLHRAGRMGPRKQMVRGSGIGALEGGMRQ